MDGHGPHLGGAIVRQRQFDWMAVTWITPDDYHGIYIQKIRKEGAFIINVHTSAQFWFYAVQNAFAES